MPIFKFRNLKSGQAMPLPPGEFTVGRSDQAYIHVEDPSISRRHAKVINNADGLFVEDTGSANGTAMGGSLIVGRKQLNVGDIIHIGSVPFRVDPEVGGDNVTPVAPMAGRRSANRDYMRRDTERLSVETVEKAVEEAFAAPTEEAVVPVAQEPEPAELPASEAPEPEPTPAEPVPKGGWFHGFAKPVPKVEAETAIAPRIVGKPTIAPEPRVVAAAPATGNGILGFLGKSKTQTVAVPKIVEASPIAFEVNSPDIEVLTAICTLVFKGALKGGVKITGSYNVQALSDLRSTRNIKLTEEADFIVLS